MKQKYTLNIADMQLNVVTEAAPETVEKISGMIDRKMREIFLQSRSVNRNEAAILCAMEFLSERMGMQGRVTELEDLNKKYDEVLRLIKTRNDELTAELEKAEKENELLRSLITTKKEEEEPATTPVKPVSPSELLEEIAVAQTEPEPAQPVQVKAVRKRRVKAEPVEEPAPAPADTEEKPHNKVGAMYDLLSFDEV